MPFLASGPEQSPPCAEECVIIGDGGAPFPREVDGIDPAVKACEVIEYYVDLPLPDTHLSGMLPAPFCPLVAENHRQGDASDA